MFLFFLYFFFFKYRSTNSKRVRDGRGTEVEGALKETGGCVIENIMKKQNEKAK